MKYTEHESLRLSRIGLGTGRFGTKVPKADAFAQMDCFLAGGGRVLDTARNYYEWVENGRGVSERTIGEWLHAQGCRDDVVLVTKGGVRNHGNEWTIDLSRDALLTEAGQSLDALGTDHVDIYLLHRDEPGRQAEDIARTLREVQSLTGARAVGAANWSAARIAAVNEAAGEVLLSVVQTWWSLAEYTDAMWNDPNTTHMDEATYRYCVDNSLLGMAYTSQCKGFFQKAMQVGIEHVDAFLRSRIETPANLRKLEYIRRVCQRTGASPTAVVTGYITSNRLNGVALVSCSGVSQLQDILHNADYTLEQQAIDELDAL